MKFYVKRRVNVNCRVNEDDGDTASEHSSQHILSSPDPISRTSHASDQPNGKQSVLPSAGKNGDVNGKEIQPENNELMSVGSAPCEFFSSSLRDPD